MLYEVITRRGHYSFGKAVDVLGIGRDQLVTVDTDADNRIDLGKLKENLHKLRDRNISYNFV